MLAINDEILRATDGALGPETLRVGIAGDIAGVRIVPVLARFRARWPHVPFSVNVTNFEHMRRELKHGDLDLAVAVVKSPPAIPARHWWLDQAVWARSAATQVNPHGPVPLVSFGEDCPCRQSAVEALNRIGRDCDFVFTSPGIASLEAAVIVGLGVMVLPRSRVAMTSLAVWDDAPLPPLPDLHCGIFLREGDMRAELAELADHFADVLRPQLRVAEDAAEPVRAAGS
jgi:DNA-binding transcriptional LysR family regulator